MIMDTLIFSMIYSSLAPFHVKPHTDKLHYNCFIDYNCRKIISKMVCIKLMTQNISIILCSAFSFIPSVGNNSSSPG